MLIRVEMPPSPMVYTTPPVVKVPGSEIEFLGVKGNIVMVTADELPAYIVDFWDLAGRDKVECEVWLREIAVLLRAARVDKIESWQHKTITVVAIEVGNG